MSFEEEARLKEDERLKAEDGLIQEIVNSLNIANCEATTEEFKQELGKLQLVVDPTRKYYSKTVFLEVLSSLEVKEDIQNAVRKHIEEDLGWKRSNGRDIRQPAVTESPVVTTTQPRHEFNRTIDERLNRKRWDWLPVTIAAVVLIAVVVIAWQTRHTVYSWSWWHRTAPSVTIATKAPAPITTAPPTSAELGHLKGAVDLLQKKSRDVDAELASQSKAVATLSARVDTVETTADNAAKQAAEAKSAASRQPQVRRAARRTRQAYYEGGIPVPHINRHYKIFYVEKK